MQITVSQFHQSQEVNQVICRSTDEARKIIEEGNASAASGWRWGLSQSNFFRDDGSEMNIDEENAIRRACGVAEY